MNVYGLYVFALLVVVVVIVVPGELRMYQRGHDVYPWTIRLAQFMHRHNILRGVRW